jgi:hypothetical protein
MFDQLDNNNTHHDDHSITQLEFDSFPSDAAIRVADTTSVSVPHPLEINDFGEEVIGYGDNYEPYWPVSALLSNR